MWDGDHCQQDTDGCEDCTCYGGVSCTDSVSPESGAKCGSCPSGLFKADERCSGEHKFCSYINLVHDVQILMSVVAAVFVSQRKTASILKGAMCVSVKMAIKV